MKSPTAVPALPGSPSQAPGSAPERPHTAARTLTAGSDVRGVVEVSLAMVFAGSSVVVGKHLAAGVPVFLAAELSLCAALAAILPLQAARLRELRSLSLRELGSMALQALFGIVLFRVFTLTGLRYTSAVHAGIITSAAPAVTALLAMVLLGERPGRSALIGIVLTAAGLCIVNLGGATDAGDSRLAGNLLVGAAVVCEAMLTILRRKAGGRVGSVTNTTVLVATAALMLLPLALNDARSGALSRMGPGEWLAILYYGAVATVIAYILWGDGAIRIAAHKTGIAMAVLPVSALVLSVLVLREPLGAAQAAGCAVAAAGIVVGSRGTGR